MNKLEELLKVNSHIGYARDLRRDVAVRATGFTALDAALPAGGWPAGLIWVNCPVEGIGEMRLFLPVIRRLTEQARRVVFLNPPCWPYAPALARAGVALEYLRVITPQRFADSLWVADKLARSNTCGLVLFWRSADDRVTAMHLRRLQLGAREGGTSLVVYSRDARQAQAEGLSAWATLALRLRAGDPEGLTVCINKARGLSDARQVHLTLPP